MTIHSHPTVQRGVEIEVPLSNLKRSPRNARKTPHAASDIETLAASIAAKGILQPPVVEPERDAQGVETGNYLVTIGEGRRLALFLLAKRKAITRKATIRCLLDIDNDAFEVSLDENVTRFAMHPADQFDAFKELADTKGWSAEEIGARFGVTAHVVRQRLRLAAVSPSLIAAYRAGDLTLDQLTAFAVSEDHDRQEQVYANLSYNRSPSAIRRSMTELNVDATDRRAVFVGPDEYQAAGGTICRDLFSEDQGGWFEDAALLDRLVLEKLASIAQAAQADDGWRWAEAVIDFPHGHGLRRIYPSPVDPDEDTAARIKALQEAQERLFERYQDGGLTRETAEERSEAIEEELADIQRPIYSESDRALAGVFVSLAHDGGVRIDRGFVRPEDEPPAPGAGNEGEGDEQPAIASGPKPLSERLVADLTAHRTAALRDRLAGSPHAALLAVVHAVALPTFFAGRDESCLELRFSSAALDRFAEGYPGSPADDAISARHAVWTQRLPEQAGQLWEALVSLPSEDLLELMAHCVSLSINAVREPMRSKRALAHADQLACYLSLDMTCYWQATAESYFGRISKPQIIEAVAEGKSPEAAAKLDGLKKDALAIAAADLLGSDGWLPPLLRAAAAGPA